MPELELSKDEATELAKAYSDVEQYYPSMRLDPRVAAIVNLGACVSIVYGSRITAWKMRRAMTKKQKPVAVEYPSDVPTQNPVETQFKPMPEMTREMRKGEIPGVGAIEFPPDHPLFGGRKH